MSMITYTCECGRTYNFRPRSAGQAEVCLACRRPYFVPTLEEFDEGGLSSLSEMSGSDVGENALPSSGSGSSATGSKILEETQIGKILYRCRCGNEIEFSGRFSGRVANCARCKCSFVVPPPDESTIVPVDDLAREIGIAVMAETRQKDRTPHRLGHYRLQGDVGRGGMGKVQGAWDERLHREVALKQVAKDPKRDSANARNRIVREARIAARLGHPNIIPVHSLEFDEDGEPYYTMQLLEGSSFAFKIRQYHRGGVRNSNLRDLLKSFAVVCRTVAFAHSNNILHRDIKPSNIYLDGFGKPYVIDWGLAKSVSPDPEAPPEVSGDRDSETVLEEDMETDDAHQDLTLEGKLVGTYLFQSPEYRRTRQSRPSDDIYALGVTLYFLLCGKFPYTRDDIKSGKQKDPPKNPRTLNLEVDVPLASICLKSLEYDLTRRFKNATELAELLELWLADVPMPGHTFAERVRRFFRRKTPTYHRTVCAFLVGVALLVGVAIGKLLLP